MLKFDHEHKENIIMNDTNILFYLQKIFLIFVGKLIQLFFLLYFTFPSHFLYTLKKLIKSMPYNYDRSINSIIL